jgi:hypothetical protein
MRRKLALLTFLSIVLVGVVVPTSVATSTLLERDVLTILSRRPVEKAKCR